MTEKPKSQSSNESESMRPTDTIKIKIRRKWNDYRIAEVEYSRLSYLHWDNRSGGVGAPAPQYFIHGYVWCNQYEGDLAHSCAHGDGPHEIKVCIVKTDNDPKVFAKLKSIVGEKPKYTISKLLKSKNQKH